jgi:hypothetical protein
MFLFKGKKEVKIVKKWNMILKKHKKRYKNLKIIKKVFSNNKEY